MSNSFNYSENPIYISKGNIATRMKDSPLAPGELFLNYQKNVVQPTTGKRLSNPYELWIGTLNPKQPLRVGAGGFLTLTGYFSEFFDTYAEPTGDNYKRKARIPTEVEYSSLRIGNVYYIDDDLCIDETDSNPAFVGGDLAVYFGGGKWWNTSNSQYIDEIEYHPTKRNNHYANVDYKDYDANTNNAKDALDSLYTTKADIDPKGKLYYSAIPDEILALTEQKFSPQYGTFEVRNNEAINAKDTLAVNPTNKDYIDQNNATKAHSVDIRGDLRIRDFSALNAFGPQHVRGKRPVGFGVNGKLFGFPYNMEKRGFQTKGKSFGNVDVSNEVLAHGNIITDKSAIIKENADIYQNLSVTEDAFVNGNLYSHGYMQKRYQQIDLYEKDAEAYHLVCFKAVKNADTDVELSTISSDINYAKLHLIASSYKSGTQPSIVVLDNTQNSLIFSSIKTGEDGNIYVGLKGGQMYNVALNTSFELTDIVDEVEEKGPEHPWPDVESSLGSIYSDSYADKIYVMEKQLAEIQQRIKDTINRSATWAGTAEELKEALKIPQNVDGHIPENALIILTDDNERLS